MTDPQPSLPAPRTALWVRIVLFVSLALNLLVVGIVVGFLTMGGPGDRRGQSAEGPFRMPYVTALNEEDRRNLGRQLRREIVKTRLSQEAWRAQFGPALALLRADPFDRAAFDAEIAGKLTTHLRRADLGRAKLVEHVASMSFAERQAYAERMEDAIAKGRYQGRHKKPRDDR